MKFQDRNFLHSNRKNSCNRSEKQSFFFLSDWRFWYLVSWWWKFNLFFIKFVFKPEPLFIKNYASVFGTSPVHFCSKIRGIKIFPGLEWCVTALARLAVRESAYFRIGLFNRKLHMTNCNLFSCGYHIDQKKVKAFFREVKKKSFNILNLKTQQISATKENWI